MIRNGRISHAALVVSITGLLIALTSAPAMACDQGGSTAEAVEVADSANPGTEAEVLEDVQAILPSDSEPIGAVSWRNLEDNILRMGLGAPINRSEVVARAQYWLGMNVPYSQDGREQDPQGQMWRTDCSGLVSMAWRVDAGGTPAGMSTSQLPLVADPISPSEAKPGDLLLRLTGSPHAMLFMEHTGAGVARVIHLTTERTRSGIFYEDQPTTGYGYYRYRQIRDDRPRPTGAVSNYVWTEDGLMVEGWAKQTGYEGQVMTINLLVDGQHVATTSTSLDRADTGAKSGFRGYVSRAFVAAGGHTLCVDAVSLDPLTMGGSLGCGQFYGSDPQGRIDEYSPVGNGMVYIRGWVVNPALPLAAARAHVYVDGRFAAEVAMSLPRPDVQQVYPQYGPTTGFHVNVWPGAGSHQICVYGISIASNNNAVIPPGCQNVQVH